MSEGTPSNVRSAMVLSLVPTTPAGHRSEQLKPGGDMSAPSTEKPLERPPNVFDALLAGLRRTMSDARTADVTIISGLDTLGLALHLSTDFILPLANRMKVDLGQTVLDSLLTDEEKFTLALSNRELARLCAQMIGIMGKLTPALVNELSSRTFLIDDYIWNADVLLHARISGASGRWALKHMPGHLVQLAGLLEFMETAPERTRLSLINGRDRDGRVELTFPGTDVAA